MSQRDKQVYYWLKMRKDFFKQHEIKIIRAMPDGEKYVLFYLQLLTESITHEGNLRCSDKIPYTVEMLAAITDTEPEVARGAMDILTKLGLVTVDEDDTVVMLAVKEQGKEMVGSETGQAQKLREWRKKDDKEVTNGLQTGYKEVTNGLQCNPEIRDKSIDINKSINNKKMSMNSKTKSTDIRDIKDIKENNIYQLYQKSIGLINPVICDKLDLYVEDYGEDVVAQAVKVAAECTPDKRNVRYIGGICRNIAYKTGNKDGPTPQPDCPVCHGTGTETLYLRDTGEKISFRCRHCFDPERLAARR